jgi:hypothetical protein
MRNPGTAQKSFINEATTKINNPVLQEKIEYLAGIPIMKHKLVLRCSGVLAFLLALMVSLCHSEEFMSADELKPGMKGMGKTVFSGTEISEFEVEILGVLKNIYPKGDLILARLHSEVLDDTGLIAGMSGSPVYIDGKLIGAVAYGWGFTKETIAGITPIMEMLSLLDDDIGTKPTAWHGRHFCRELSQPLSIGRHRYNRIIVNTEDPASSEYSPSAIVLNAIATPLMAGGFLPEVLNEMEPVFGKFGLMPVQTGRRKDKTSGKLAPGAVVGVQLLSGDCELSASGTVTYCRDGKILAFGHPFMARGKVDLPMTNGSVQAILSSHAFSFKLSSSGAVVGRIGKDTRVAIGGELGKFAKLISSRIRVKAENESKEFNYRMIQDEFWATNLLSWCLLNSILSSGLSGEKSASLNMRIKLAGFREPIVFENIFSKSLPAQNANPLGWQAEVPKLLTGIMANQFREVAVENIDVEIELSDKPVTAVIERIKIDRTEVEPGEDVNLTIVLKPYGAEYITRGTTLHIPEDLPEGEITLFVCDARNSMRMTAVMNPEKHKPHSFDQLVDILQEGEKNNEIAVRLFLPRGGVTVQGEELPSLPGSIISIMSSSRETGVERLTGEISRRIPTRWVISGCHQLVIRVERK